MVDPLVTVSNYYLEHSNVLLANLIGWVSIDGRSCWSKYLTILEHSLLVSSIIRESIEGHALKAWPSICRKPPLSIYEDLPLSRALAALRSRYSPGPAGFYRW